MRTWVLFLYDIDEAISSIDEFIAGMTIEEFSRDKKTISAVRDQIMIIGEAVHHIPDEILTEYPQIPWRDIVGMRNVLVHSYFRTDPELLFMVATERLATLSPVISGMIAKYSS